MGERDRVIARLSRSELERRWKLVRDHMRQNNLDALVAQASGDSILGGPVRWLTGTSAAGYIQVVLFPVNDLMTVIQHGAMGRRQKFTGDEPDHLGIGERIETATFLSAHFTHGYEAEIVLEEAQRRGWRKVGLVRPGQWHHRFVSLLAEGLSGRAELTDETEFIDHCKAIKSTEEMALLRKTCAMQDEVFARVIAEIKPGMRDIEVASLARHYGNLVGSDGEGVFLSGSARIGEPAFPGMQHWQGRTIEKGDVLNLLIENNSAHGYYAEVARTVVLGKAPAEILEGFELTKTAQENTLRQLKAGASPRAIYASHNEYMKAKGQSPELRLYCHGQGYDLVERPLVRHDEAMKLEKNMFLACHPAYVSRTAMTMICDNYFVEESGASACVHKTPKKVYEI